MPTRWPSSPRPVGPPSPAPSTACGPPTSTAAAWWRHGTGPGGGSTAAGPGARARGSSTRHSSPRATAIRRCSSRSVSTSPASHPTRPRGPCRRSPPPPRGRRASPGSRWLADCLVGPPGFYTGRPGFWHGSVGVAAAWAGGALGVADAVLARPSDDTHRLVHAGAVHAATWTMRAALAEAAREIDDDPRGPRRRRNGPCAHRATRRRAHRDDRSSTAAVERSARRRWPSDAAHAQRVADLSLYLRQHHSEHDLALIGEHVLPR